MFEEQYLCLATTILAEGENVYNERTGKYCKTIINADLEYHYKDGLPLVTTRQCYWKPAIAELIGYIRGYNSAKQFRKLGTKTWDANANINQDWLNNPNRSGKDDMGRVYGVQGRGWVSQDGFHVDQLDKVISNLSQGIDDRGEVVTYWNPGEFNLGCLRPCMHTYTFSLVNKKLYLTVYQRSCDVPLGLTFNTVQAYTMLGLVAMITGSQPGTVYHKIVNAHIYEDQAVNMVTQFMRDPFESPRLHINHDIQSLNDLETWVTLDDFQVTGYRHHDPIKYEFSV